MIKGYHLTPPSSTHSPFITPLLLHQKPYSYPRGLQRIGDSSLELSLSMGGGGQLLFGGSHDRLSLEKQCVVPEFCPLEARQLKASKELRTARGGRRGRRARAGRPARVVGLGAADYPQEFRWRSLFQIPERSRAALSRGQPYRRPAPPASPHTRARSVGRVRPVTCAPAPADGAYESCFVTSSRITASIVLGKFETIPRFSTSAPMLE
ncbi:hypothetical protein EVAR_86366_1 [Eumeta japonica]|uniref:Uncharacterized protein n=1 Tax=Eumeta variegata TaxID=151549 RepID=A0A4C1YCM1_EUMVA|nr:hypothetical protein EVAR_86366_1 [Eumeta japonica]